MNENQLDQTPLIPLSKYRKSGNSPVDNESPDI